MSKIKKFLDAAEGNWDVQVVEAFGVVNFSRPDHVPGDGYPALVVIDYDTSTDEVTAGRVYTSYDPYGALEEYELGSRSLLGVITDITNPFRYKAFHEAWLATTPNSTSEKLLAERIDESERQIRNARITGSMSGYMADKLCVVVLGKHPMETFGYDAWIEHQSKGAWPEPSKPRK